METYRNGVDIEGLPQTFQDAMMFAAKLPEVGYIWIDSLCIVQGDETDWLGQSATMDKVYRNAWLNISATASSSSDEGLFREREPKLLVEDEIIVNIASLPGNDDDLHSSEPSQHRNQDHHHYRHLQGNGRRLEYGIAHPLAAEVLQETEQDGHEAFHHDARLRRSDSALSALSNDASILLAPLESLEDRYHDLRRCTILDVSFWTNLVDDAPVNKRGWVLQERLMAPRVLHFCRDQVAWECQEYELAEGHPEEIPNYLLIDNGVREGSKLKNLNAGTNGKWLRELRLQGYPDPDQRLQPAVYSLELWRRIVEVYSKTAITQPKDKLIALSGIARWMSRELEQVVPQDFAGVSNTGQARIKYQCATDPDPAPNDKPVRYMAGIWTFHIASQLLWYTEPIYIVKDESVSYEYVSTSPEAYRAPSFSWASIDTGEGSSIKHADVTTDPPLIEVEEISVQPKQGSDEFGILDAAHMVIWGQLLKVKLSLEEGTGRYEWRLINHGDLSKEKHTIVYLDCPSRDNGIISDRDAGIFVVPTALGDPTAAVGSKYTICLILQVDRSNEAGPTFRRIGLTKLSPYADAKTMLEIKTRLKLGIDKDIPNRGYDKKTGHYRIFLE
ncbi:hypothetical protein NX059_003663 [Plenodomus lindquistii]|nr:hypothetical protein NX059_003663 [Plenodomus lindquistii]